MNLIDIIPEKELKETVLSEFEKRLVLYKLTDEKFKKKYGMNFDDFEERNIVKEKDFSWEVEKDAMDWEHAIESLRYLREKIDKIKEADEI